MSGSPVPSCNCPVCTQSRGGMGSLSNFSFSANSSPFRQSAAPRAAGFDGSADFDFAVGTVRGYRWWKLDAPDLAAPWDDWQIRPLTGAQSKAWAPGVNLAACNYYPHHQPPVEVDPQVGQCGCGFWAYWTMTEHQLGGDCRMPVCGVVDGFGRTLVGDRGFRCEKARIVALCLPFTIEPAPGFGTWFKDNGDRFRDERNVYGARLTEGGMRTFNAMRESAMREWDSATAPNADADVAADTALAREFGQAWMAVIQDRLMTLYPGVDIYATRKAMMAKYPAIGAPRPDEHPAG